MNSMKNVEQLSNFCCEKYIFDSNFDSGNLFKVELVKKITNSNESVQGSNGEQSSSSSSSTTNNGSNSSNQNSKERQIDIEFNLWTRPDNYCAGPSDNSKKCRNLECNGNCGNLNHGNRTWFFFSIRGGEKNQLVKLNLVNLNKQAKLFSQGMHPVMRNGNHGKWERTKEKPTFLLTDDSFVLSLCHRTNENVEENTVFYAFTFPFTYTEHIHALDSYDKKYKKSLEELEWIVSEMNQTTSTTKEKIVIDQNVNSFSNDNEKERSRLNVTNDDATCDGTFLQDNFENILLTNRSSSIDENTSDSMQQLSSLVNNVQIEKQPEYFESLPPPPVMKKVLEDIKTGIYYYRELLINSYEHRRVDLLTITSFDGIEEDREERLRNLFPDYTVPRCHKFRNKKIIFISSRVHPGETPSSFVLNGFLNFLLDRKNQTAMTLRKLYVFKIIPFLNPDGVYNGLYRGDTLGHNLNRVYLNPKLDRHPSIYAVRKLIRYYHFGCDKPDTGNESFDMGMTTDDKDDVMSMNDSCMGDQFDYDSLNIDKEEIPMKVVVETRMKEPNEQKHIIGTKQRCTLNKKLKESAMSVKNVLSMERRSASKDEPTSKAGNSHHNFKHFISHYNCEKAAEKMFQQNIQNQQNLNISMDFRIKTDENGEKSITEENSNLFLYLDLHGHASKKGVFMYGNHLSNIFEAVEVMLLPKLMSLNCHHFHFDFCNFSERNMYLKGRRDGLSKEGSGRVAIYKATGLIKSYTLESNYNIAKCVNVLPPKGKELSSKIHNLVPPKFTPAIFEEVGRALGPSLLDLTNSNPQSRIQNSEYRSLQGLRNSLKHEISRGLSRSRINKFAKLTKKRQTSTQSTSIQDTSKENENNCSFTSSSLNVPNTLPSTTQNSHQQIIKSQISSVLKVTPTAKSGKVTTFIKKEAPLNKKKILRENVTTTTLTNQIPHKKIRVSNSSNNNSAVNTTTEKEATSCYVNDIEPCCSRSITSFIYKPPSSPSGSSTTSSTGQVKITSFLPIKKVGVKFNNPGGSKAATTLKKGRSLSESTVNDSTAPTFHSLSEKLLKKKKRLLKSETTIKRKKSRPQKPLV
ncbi:hypothetical protein PVAND_007960 [Polypedilum vanderplanki]|uniref:tubulin-glutamate carboxypeptidase n=1 Tax=Polypedilum vanderplanki TaxID=319348 RepID=A0A9J6C9F2_POLVA|nr:hypothetical protein PVAND_007960 [Polypedilum vanderplanki]